MIELLFKPSFKLVFFNQPNQSTVFSRPY